MATSTNGPIALSAAPVTLCIELNEGEFLHSKVVRLEKGWTLRFKRGKGLLGNEALLRISDTDTVVHFPSLKHVQRLDQEDAHDFHCNQFGAFKYEFFTIDSSQTPVGCGYFCVVPQWSIADGGRVLSLNGMSVVTHISKLLGPLREWEDRLRVAKESGYNVIHFTPVQKLGVSNSAYSIADYHQLNPAFEADFEQLNTLVRKMERDWHVLSICDVVWNHCAKNADWIWQHPECSYNCLNSPHLRPAFVVDRALQQLSREVAAGEWASQGVPALIDTETHLLALRHLLEEKVFPSLRLHEFLQLDVDKWVKEFERRGPSGGDKSKKSEGAIEIIPDPEYRRFGASVDVDVALAVCENVGEFRLRLEKLNDAASAEAAGHVASAINATMGHVAYERVDAHGPKRGAVTSRASTALVTQYFLFPTDRQPTTWEEEEKLAYNSHFSPYFMACNGWIMNADPLANFAEPPSNVYLRRELVCWGDCVKLNYGQRPEDCPYLWNYIQEYSEQCAKIFHGFRIDNCHSTPIHVAEHLLKAARKVRKDLYVIAELFTGSEELDNLFVNRLGITSLIRECQNAPDSHEQGRFIYRYGGDPVGAFRSKTTRPAPAGVAHALLYDQTHDNPPAFKKRTAYDYVPTAAMTAMGYSALGSTRGYDEFIPYMIDVVHEKRLYRGWSELESGKIGMIKARKLFNDLHARLVDSGFTEIFVDQVSEDVVAITRHHPATHQSVLLIAHTCFSKFKWTPECRGVSVADDIVDILFEVKTVEDTKMKGDDLDSSKHLKGLPQFSVEIYEHVALDKCSAVEINDGVIHFKTFTSGSVVAFKCEPKLTAFIVGGLEMLRDVVKFRIEPKQATTTACKAIEEIVGNDNTREGKMESDNRNAPIDKAKTRTKPRTNAPLFRGEEATTSRQRSMQREIHLAASSTSM